MIVDSPGKIADGLYLMGRQITLMYLVKGRYCMIINGGMNWVVPLLEEQLVQAGVRPDELKYLVITHPHFDHCGAVPYLKRKYPGIKVLATKAAREVLGKQKVIDYMEEANMYMIDHFSLRDKYESLNLTIDSINVDQIVDGSTVIDLGNGLEIHFIETPGHSPGDIAVYIPHLKAIFPSDAAPCPLGDIKRLTMPSPQFDFKLYKESLRKLAGYDVEVCGFDHNCVITGSEARQVLVNALKWTEDYGKKIVEIFREKGDIEQTARWVALERLKTDGFSFLNEELMLPVARAEVRNILKDAEVLEKPGK